MIMKIPSTIFRQKKKKKPPSLIHIILKLEGIGPFLNSFLSTRIGEWLDIGFWLDPFDRPIEMALPPSFVRKRCSVHMEFLFYSPHYVK